MELPVLSLEYEYEAYRALGRLETARRIRGRLPERSLQDNLR